MSALDQRSRPSCSQHRDGAGLLGTVLLLFSQPPLVQSCVSRLNPQTSVKITVSVSISNLYPGCEHMSVRSRSMMFEPGLTRGTLEVLVALPQHPHCAADDQSTKAIDIQNAYLNGKTPMDGIPLPD